jgi:hypothetical protein
MMNEVKRIDSWNGYVEFTKEGVFLMKVGYFPKREEKVREHHPSPEIPISYQEDEPVRRACTPPPRIPIHTYQIVDVYKNLHKDTWSIRSVKTGRVIGHSDLLLLADAEFIVRPGGRNRVLKERRKNVHAVVRGSLVAVEDLHPQPNKVYSQVSYDPYLYPYFYMPEKGEDRKHYYLLENIRRLLYNTIRYKGKEVK